MKTAKIGPKERFKREDLAGVMFILVGGQLTLKDLNAKISLALNGNLATSISTHFVRVSIGLPDMTQFHR